MQDTITVCCCLQAVAHERPAVRCAAMAALGSLSQSVYSRLDLAQQRQIWHCIQSCSAECASAVQAAALKALGTLAMCPSSHAYPGEHDHEAAGYASGSHQHNV